MAALRKTLTQFTDVVFPTHKLSQSLIPAHHLIKSGNEYVSSLPLQMALYFNGFYFPFWFICVIMSFVMKYNYLSMLYRIILIAIILTLTIVEIVRLYIGFMGNLTEKVPELAGCWLLTIIIQFPLTLFILLNEATWILPLERAANIVLLAFLVVQMISGYFAIRSMVHLQVTKFHLKQFHDLEDLDGGLPLYEENGSGENIRHRINSSNRA
ncbi:transmembrane protein 17B-like [Tubulanus polymorphus]|uniref:transmembrane protein 17B-like n=1 Tax=Tubulanus polymorphus TaxID=672921 RepID=UPI003DA681BC